MCVRRQAGRGQLGLAVAVEVDGVDAAVDAADLAEPERRRQSLGGLDPFVVDEPPDLRPEGRCADQVELVVAVDIAEANDRAVVRLLEQLHLLLEGAVDVLHHVEAAGLRKEAHHGRIDQAVTGEVAERHVRARDAREVDQAVECNPLVGLLLAQEVEERARRQVVARIEQVVAAVAVEVAERRAAVAHVVRQAGVSRRPATLAVPEVDVDAVGDAELVVAADRHRHVEMAIAVEVAHRRLAAPLAVDRQAVAQRA